MKKQRKQTEEQQPVNTRRKQLEKRKRELLQLIAKCTLDEYQRLAAEYSDAVAVEAHSNEVSPCIKTVNGFTVIVEPYEQEIKQLVETQPIKGGQFLDCYNQSVTDMAGTIRTTIDHSNMFFYTEEMKDATTHTRTKMRGSRQTFRRQMG